MRLSSAGSRAWPLSLSRLRRSAGVVVRHLVPNDNRNESQPLGSPHGGVGRAASTCNPKTPSPRAAPSRSHSRFRRNGPSACPICNPQAGSRLLSHKDIMRHVCVRARTRAASRAGSCSCACMPTSLPFNGSNSRGKHGHTSGQRVNGPEKVPV